MECGERKGNGGKLDWINRYTPPQKINGSNKPVTIFCCPNSLLTIFLQAVNILSNRVPIQYQLVIEKSLDG